MNTVLLAYIAALNTIIAGAFLFELAVAGKRYRGEMVTLLVARVTAELERVLRDRISGQRHVRAGQQRNGERRKDEPAGEDELAHALRVTARSDGEVRA